MKSVLFIQHLQALPYMVLMAPMEARVFNTWGFCKWIEGTTNPSLIARSVKNFKFLYFIFPYPDRFYLEPFKVKEIICHFCLMVCLLWLLFFFPSCSESYIYTSTAKFVGFCITFLLKNILITVLLFKKLNWKLKIKYEIEIVLKDHIYQGLCIFMEWFSSNQAYKNE